MLMSLPWAACKETRVIPGGEKTRSVTPGGSVVAGKTPATPGKTRRLSVSGSYKMKLLPAGTFRMGAVPEDGNQFSKLAHPPHSVSITRSFYLGLTEVPQWYYSHVASKNHSLCRAANIPAHNVTWYDAVRFANQVSRREGLKPCYTIKGKDVLWPEGPACEGYRLPSEAEWEYAARAGSLTAFYQTDGNDGSITHIKRTPLDLNLDQIAWYGGNSTATYGGAYDCSLWFGGLDLPLTLN